VREGKIRVIGDTKGDTKGVLGPRRGSQVRVCARACACASNERVCLCVCSCVCLCPFARARCVRACVYACLCERMCVFVRFDQIAIPRVCVASACVRCSAVRALPSHGGDVRY
jgi:hypothetical protein